MTISLIAPGNKETVVDVRPMRALDLELDQIRMYDDLQSPTTSNKEMTEEYADYFRRSVDLSPIDVMFDNTNYWNVYGDIRLQALKLVEKGHVLCNVTEVTRGDAQGTSYVPNMTRGSCQTNADRALAVKRALRHPKGVRTSDSAIANHVGVSDKTIAEYLAELESTSKIPRFERTVGKGGKSHRRPVQPHPEEPQSDHDVIICDRGVEDCKPGLNMCERCISKPVAEPDLEAVVSQVSTQSERWAAVVPIDRARRVPYKDAAMLNRGVSRR